ncbi:hypothetical protein EMPS_04212 [Entomortierella parvispora]|uniref:Uncharacterized protein n=1 Tax=Entomortierella parvispora TaxID=205924 RepID=A0A9P3H8A1_9FUNG|nr:hypothetical protein EMPS_04212 [Entomortierella parvispora]
MSALFDILTFNGLQKKPVPSRYGANHEILEHVTSKWHIPEKGTFTTLGTCSGIDHYVYLKTSKDGSSPEQLVFDSRRGFFDLENEILFMDLGSPLCLYRLSCTFPSAVYIEQHYKSAWWLALTHKATGRFFGFEDIKGRVALRIRSREVFLMQYWRKDKERKSAWETLAGVNDKQSAENLRVPYVDALPQELIDTLSAPETGDPELLEELSKVVEDNRIFKEEMLELLNYLASDQCAHGYDDLVAGYVA